MNIRRVVSAVSAIVLAAVAAASAYSVASSPHDMRSPGGVVREGREDNAECIFCHAPDNVSAAAFAWAHQSVQTLPVSSGVSGAVPTGASKQCLGCHDGVLGASSMHAAQPAPGSNAQRQNPAVPPGTHVFSIDDADGRRIECTSCHDPHAVKHPQFLVAPRQELCGSCHEMQGFAGSAHDYIELAPPVEAGYACQNCHTPHAAPAPRSLLSGEGESLCFTCHGSTLKAGRRLKGDAPTDIERLMTDDAYGFFDNFTGTGRWVNTAHDVTDTAQQRSGARLECINCHGPHRAAKDDPNTPDVIESLVDPDDVSSPFTLKGEPTHYRGTDPVWRKAYAIDHFCLKCHDGGMPRNPDRPDLAVVPPSVNNAEIINIETVFDRMAHTSQYKIPCVVCHDPHGGNPYILNGDIRWENAPFATKDAPASSFSTTVNVSRNPVRFDICYASCHRDTEGHQLERENCQKCHNHRLNM